MERIYALIDKLNQQKKENASPAHLLFTVQLLQTELSKMQHKNGSLGTKKVAVTLPVNFSFAEEVVRSVMADVFEEPVMEDSVIESEPAVNEVPLQNQYSLNKPAVDFHEEVKPVVKEEQKPSFATQPVLNPAFDAVEENPAYVPYMPKRPAPDYTQHQPKKETIDYTQYQAKKEAPAYTSYQPIKEAAPVSYQPANVAREVSTKKELHETIGSQKESLNDRLKEEKKELVHTFTATPIKDLRRAIGINDRFTFVSELFRGDDAGYERSIKTINEFNVFSEAEYWINRELKFKLGWNDANETVQHFYQLVRRRFS